MKKLFLTLVTAITCQFLSAQYCGPSGPSICSPSGGFLPTGFNPSSENQPPLINGDVSSTVIHFQNFDTITFAGQSLKIQSLRIDSIGYLPFGLCWSTNMANNTFANVQAGCIAINGSPCSMPGQYRLKIIITAYVGSSAPGVPIQTDAGAAGLYYYLRVKNIGEADIMVDTVGQAANTNTFIPYGTSTDCSQTLGVEFIELGHITTICDGSSITLNPIVHGGQPPYTYSWSSNGSAMSCLTCKYPVTVPTSSASAYSVTVLDANNVSATGTVSFMVGGAATPVFVSTTNTGIDCAHNDTTIVTATGGTPPYVFRWSNYDTIVGGSPQQRIYSQPGEYVVTVVDANTCVTSIADTIPFTGILITAAQTVQPTCAGTNTGKLKVSASGGTPPYTFAWNNGATADSIVNVAAGNYRVTVTDAAACSFSKNFNVAPVNGWGYYAYLQSSVSNCNNNGTITTIQNGGVPPFTFLWSNGSTVQNLTGLSGGVYYVTVTDGLGCTATGSTSVSTSCYSLINGTVFNDTNSNCIFDAGENYLNGIYVTATGGGQTYYGSMLSNGSYTISIPAAGTFTLNAVNPYSYGTCSNIALCNNASQTVTIATIGDTSNNNNFGFTGTTGFDLSLFMRWSAGNPGFDKTYRIYAQNNSYIPLAGQATVTFGYDANLIYQSSNVPVVHDLANHTLTWAVVDSLGNLWGGWGGSEILANFLVPVNLSLGYMLQSDFRISPTIGDCDSSNNHVHTSDAVTGSYDPNEKIVEPAGRILEEDSILTYTIGFQNTGTDSTHFIILKDTLSANLDAGTVRNIASSHPYSDFEISGKGILTWTFNPLRLVDSFTNEKESHGFVKFTIKKKSNLPVGSIISNKAYIYFDYNEAVITNTVSDTISEPNSIFEVRSTDGISVKAFPNPFANATNIVVDDMKEKFDFELFDVTGRLKKRMTGIETNQFQVTRDDLSAGVYFFKILSTNKKKTGYGKLVVE